MRGSNSGEQLFSARRASSAGLMTSKSRPVSLRTRFDEPVAVLGLPAGLRRDITAPDHIGPAHLGGADAQGVDRPGDGVLGKAARRGHALAQPDDARKGIDDPEAVGRWFGDQQTAVVRAQVDGGIGPAGWSVAYGSSGPFSGKSDAHAGLSFLFSDPAYC